MKQVLSEVQFTLLIIIGAILVTLVLLYSLIGPPWQGIRQTERDFRNNEELITLVTDYLVQSEYEQISISNYNWNGSMYVSGHGYIFIEDKEIVTAIWKLQRKGYSSIHKKANGISFVRWRNKDVGKGIVFSIDGHEPGESAFNFLTKTKPMLKENWYYYEEDYNKWRTRNRHITK